MNKLSVGCDSTLGEYKKLSMLIFGENSKATQYLTNRINESPNGENEEVIADETQMLHVLASLHDGPNIL